VPLQEPDVNFFVYFAFFAANHSNPIPYFVTFVSFVVRIPISRRSPGAPEMDELEALVSA